MAISSGGGGNETPMSDINTTPLVDVMLVLLIIFLIAIPVAIQTIEQLELPKLTHKPNETKIQNVLLSITTTDAQGRSPGETGYSGANTGGLCRVYWNVTPVTSEELQQRAIDHLENLVEQAGGAENLTPEDLPEVHVRGDVKTAWRCVAADLQNAIGWLSESWICFRTFDSI